MITPYPQPQDAIENVGLDALRALQLERLRWSLAHAYDNVPFYRRQFDQCGVHPRDLNSLEDLARFPFSAKDNLRENYPFGLFAVPRERVVRVHASSGTTGKPTVVGYTQNDIDMWADVMARSIRAAGGRPGDACHVAHGYGLFTGGLGVHYGAEKLGCMVVPVSGGQTARQVQLIRDFEPRILVATPSYSLNLADELERQGISPETCSLRVGMFGAEPWTLTMREEIEQRFGIEAHDLYGLSEVIGPGVAVECNDSRGALTVWEDHFYPEIVDPITGEVLPEGEEGELVFTSLTKEAFPVIRYRTRDLTRLLPGSTRVMRRMEKVTGRSDDMMIIRGVNVFPSQIEEILLQHQAAPHYQIELTQVRNMDAITVNAEARPGVGGEDRERLASLVRQSVKSYIGISAEINILPEGQLPRSAGKAQRIVDRR